MAILVTGGSSGIGRAIAERFAKPDVDVFINYHANAEAAAEAREAIEAKGANAHLVRADIGDPDGVASLMQEVRQSVGHLDQLVHCAASTTPGSLLTIAPDELDRSVAVNAMALIHLVREAGDMLSAGSNVVYVTSRGGRDVIANYGALGVAKALGEHIVRYLAIEVASRGVRVNSVSPGMLDTVAVRAMFPDNHEALVAAAAAANPSGRGLEMTDVAGAVELLCREEFGMVQGQTISIDGGMSLR